MAEKYITYKLGDRIFDVPESQSAIVERDYPDATIEMRMGDRVFDVPLSHKQDAIKQYGSELSYLYDKQPSVKNEESKDSFEKPKDRTYITESAGKGLGAGLLRTAKGAWDLLVKAGAGSIYIDPQTGIAERLPSYDEMVKEGRDEIKWSQNMRATADRLSKEADPTHGEKGYGELLKEGKLGLAAQKALAQGAESLPMMAAAGAGPIGMVAYGSTLAASNYADQSVDNPEIEAWKRGVYSVGTAATEMLVEKIGGPLKNIIGKGGKELTEEAAKELLERITREGSETIAKRIFKGLGNMLKEGAEEGGEEVLTAFGNDALGEALDALDGNKDYGIRAQWETYQKENPDADRWDFAVAKGKEYWEAFLGGALSGAEISGTVGGVNALSQSRHEKTNAEALQNTRDAGANMDYTDMYDLDADLNSAVDAATTAFTNDKGESSLSREFIEAMSSEEALGLSNRADISQEQRFALTELAGAKAVQEGLTGALDAKLQNEINANRILVEDAAEDGSLVVGIVGGKPMYIKGGVVNNGSLTLPNGEVGPVIAIDVKTGERTTVNSDQITDATVDSAENFSKNVEEGLRMREQAKREQARTTMSPRAKIKAIQPLVGKKIMVDFGNGIIEVGVQQMLPERGGVMIKGKKGDLDGKQFEEIGADALYDSIVRDDAGNPMFAEGEIETEEVVEAPQETEVTDEVDYRGEVVPILVNGVPTNVEVVSQDNPSDSIVYEYTDENGNTRRGSSTIRAFQSAVQGAQEYTPEIVPKTVPEEPVAETPTETTPVTEEPAPKEEPVQIQLTPEDIDWDALYEQDTEAYFAEIQNQYGEEALDVLNEEIEAAQSELDSLGNAKTKNQNERAKNRKRKAALQSRIDTLNGMIARLSPTEGVTEPATDIVAEAPATESVIETPVAEAPLTETPIKTTALSADISNTDRLEIPTRPIIKRPRTIKEMSSLEPMNATEFAARELGMKDGGIKLIKESFLHHTGYSKTEANKLKGLFASKDQGGMTVEEAGERLMEMDREYDLGLFDQNDPNAGLNAILDALSANSTMGQLRSYIARNRQEEAQREADAVYSAMMAEIEREILYDEVREQEIKSEYALSEEDYNKRNAIFAEEIYDYETGNQGEVASLYEAEDIGDLPAAEGEIYRDDRQSDSLLQETQPVQAGGEGNIEERGTRESVNLQDADASVHNGESGVSEGTSESEPVSTLDEDMPDFENMSGNESTPQVVENIPIAPKQVENPIRESQKKEKHLANQLKRYDISPEQKQDMAFKAGKDVADFFATREEYDAYAENATDLGNYNEDFERGVDESFAKRPQTESMISTEELDGTSTEAQKLATEAVLTALDDAGVEVAKATDEQTQQMMDASGSNGAEFMVAPDKPVFVSNAAIAVEAIKQEKATPEQWLKMIEKNGGLKAGEDKWIGLSDWLKASTSKTLAKQEVLKYIKENQIQIEEQHYAEVDYFAADKKLISAINDEFLAFRKEAEEAGEWIHDAGDIAYQQMVDTYGDDFSIAFGVDRGELYVSNREAASVITGVDLGTERAIDETRIGYTTEGLKNYKEIALIVPTIESWDEFDEIHFGDAGDGRAVAWVRFGETTYYKELSNDEREAIINSKPKPEMWTKHDGSQFVAKRDIYVLDETSRSKYGFIVDRGGKFVISGPIAKRMMTIQFDTFDEAVYAFYRAIVPKVKESKVLVIDEIQSKRHQEGREQGYRTSREKADAEMDKFMKQMHDKYEFSSSTPFADVFNEEEMREHARLNMQQHRATFGTSAIPDAPFDKNWHELAMKRMLRYAAENGYDVIAWTKGEQQAERYDIGGAVDSIYYAGSFKEGVKDIDINLDTRRGGNIHLQVDNNGEVINEYNDFGDVKDSPYIGKNLSEILGKELANKVLSLEEEQSLSGEGLRVGGEGMKGFYDRMLPAFMNKYGKKWGVKVSDITLPNVEEAGRVMHSVPVTQEMKDSVLEGQPMFMKRPNGTVYGWAQGNNIYYTKAGFNPNTLTHEYTHLWAKAMMQRNPKGWQSVKELLRGTPVWNEVMNDVNYSSIHANEDMVASEVLSRISGSKNAAKLEKMAQQMIDEAKGTMRKLEARGLVQRIKDALNEFWSWVGVELFGIEKFESVEQVADRVLWDLMNQTDLGTLSEGQVETQIVTDTKVIAELEASPKRTGFRNVVQNGDGTFSSPMAYWLQSTKDGAKSRVETAKFELGKWEEAEEHPELVDDNGKVTLVKPNKGTVGNVAYDPYIHNRLEPVNLQFKDAWKRDDLVYVETEVAENDLNDGYHADKALLPVGVHSWSNGDVMLSRYDKPVRIMPWEEVADAWVERLNGEGVHFDVVPPAIRSLLVERGVEILPPHKGMGKDCNEAYTEWKKGNEKIAVNRNAEPSQSDIPSGDVASHSKGAPTVIKPRQQETDANISNRTQKAKKSIKNFKNGDLEKGEIKTFADFRKELGKALGMRYEGQGDYGTYDTPKGRLLLRLNNHNAFGDNFLKGNADQNISIYVEYKHFDLPESLVPYVEFKYTPEDFEAHPEEIFKDIMKAMDTALTDGEFPKELKYATRTPHNIDEDIEYRKPEAQNVAVDHLAGPARNTVIENAVNEEAEKLGVSVTYKTREEMPKGHKNDKGYYNTKTGEIVVCTENASSINDAIQTILHEAVAHKGLRQLMGDRFNEFINRVYESLDAETKAKVDALAEKHYKGNKAVAMEEYMASLAEKEDFAKTSIWDKIKDIFNDIMNSILGRNDMKIGDNELRYILRASYANMVNPRNMETIEGWAKDTRMREEYKINEASPEILSRTGIDPDTVAGKTARQVYDKAVNKTWQEAQRQFQDAYQPVRIAIDAIQQETGNTPVEDYENYLLIQNQASSRSRVEIDRFVRNYYSPIVSEVNAAIDRIMESRGLNTSDKAQRAEVYKELRQYLIAKHGLERNEYYQNSKGEMRDYSGLTALFGFDSKDYASAEAEARNVVDTFENEVDTTELWKKINAATDKTLRHSYESGLISRKQYNDIKAMFNFYIPLRGFDETTAEDVYAYARFEGNRFNPAVQNAKGRTSVADDPLATIMNMAESEIAQGNKNRAKQALYNFILNRPNTYADGNQTQNTLMQIQSVWYYKNPDGTCTIATPNYAAGETYEEFEIRMQALEAADQAFKSKKGQVDVGMRFQKQANKDAHYIYLKVNGVEKAIYVNGDPKAAEAVNGTSRAKDDDFVKTAREVNRFLSSTFTNYSLEFTARNYFRDMVYSHINIAVKESDPAYRKKFRQNWRRNNMGTMIKMLTAYRAGEYDGRLLTADEAAFVEFMENGGQTGYTLINSVERHKKDLERAIKQMQNGIDKGGIKGSTAFKYTLGGIELLNEASELITRFAAFKTSRDMGRSVTKSVSDAKEITVNFNTKGAQDGNGILGILAHYLGWSKFFFNASVQGVQNVAAMAKANYLKFGVVAGGIFATGLLMPMITAALSELLGGDDDENEYWNIPEWERQNNICMPIGKGMYVKVPLPVGISGLYAMGDMVAAAAWDKKFTRDAMQVGTDMANKIASMILPINPLESSANGLSIWHTAMLIALPSAAHFWYQNANNIDWKGAPLQKEYTFNANDPQWMKAYASNPDWIVSLSKWCNENISEGDMKGWDWSPEKLDNTLSNLGGGIYGLIKKTGRGVSMIWNEENRNLSNVPLSSVVLGSGIDKDDRAVTDAYYDMKEYYDDRTEFVKTRAEKFGYDFDDVFDKMKGQHHPKMQEVYGNMEFDWMQEWYKGNKALEEINNDIKSLEKKIAGKENPTEADMKKLAKLKDDLAVERRDFVNDMLKLD